MTRPANDKETEEDQGKEAGNSSEYNGWTGKQAIAVCFKEAEDMEKQEHKEKISGRSLPNILTFGININQWQWSTCGLK